jgi:putative FmdB family regulatory protein
MPLYEYMCVNCSAKNNNESLFYLNAKEPPKENPSCPVCGNTKTMRGWNAPAVIFKGRGFYSTDNGDKGEIR